MNPKKNNFFFFLFFFLIFSGIVYYAKIGLISTSVLGSTVFAKQI